MLFFPILYDIKSIIALFENYRDSPAVKVKMSMEHWWNDTDRGEANYSGKKRKLVTLRLCPPQIADILMKGSALTA